VISPRARRGARTTRKPADHTFDAATPTGGDYRAGGAPAPPRDGLSALSDLYELFDFDEGDDW
jgi:hypothetical protein